MSIYQTEDSVEKSFDEDSIPEEQLQTQWAEFIALKKAIHEIAVRNNRPISIMDIGIGNARIVKHLCGIKEIWNQVSFYHGIDNAPSCLTLSQKVITEFHLEDKVSVSLLESDHLNTLEEKYDLIITTWFTGGNFYPKDFPFESYKSSGERLELEENQRFRQVFNDAFQLLNVGGELIFGSCYIDNKNTRIKQEQFYNKLGMEVITDAEDSFTATRERFWSQRFTKEKMIKYLNFAHPENIDFVALDTYDFAMQVRVKK